MVTRRHSMVMLTNDYDFGERRYILVPLGTNRHTWRPPGYAYNAVPVRTRTVPAGVATIATAPTTAAPPVAVEALAEAELGWREHSEEKNSKGYPHVDSV